MVGGVYSIGLFCWGTFLLRNRLFIVSFFGGRGVDIDHRFLVNVVLIQMFLTVVFFIFPFQWRKKRMRRLKRKRRKMRARSK